MIDKKRAVVLLSGGIDSTTALAIAVSQGYEVYSLTFRYGQRHAQELEAARKVAQTLGSREHLILTADLTTIGGSALTSEMEVPKGRSEAEIKSEIPTTYVPARNTIFLAYALAWAEVLEAWDIFLGVNAVDYSGYPDCRPEYIQAFQRMANLATKATTQGDASIKIQTPLISMTKAEIILAGTRLGVDYSITHSCYDPPFDGIACGQCDSCLLRKRGFKEAGLTDPTRYLQ